MILLFCSLEKWPFEACIWVILFYEYLNLSADASSFHLALRIYQINWYLLFEKHFNKQHTLGEFPSAHIRDLGPWLALTPLFNFLWKSNPKGPAYQRKIKPFILYVSEPSTTTTNSFSTRKKKSWTSPHSTSSQHQQVEEVWSPGTSGVVTWFRHDRTTLSSSHVCVVVKGLYGVYVLKTLHEVSVIGL